MTLPVVPVEVILLVEAEVVVITVIPEQGTPTETPTLTLTEAVPETANRILVKPVPVALVVIPEQIMQVETMAAEIQAVPERGQKVAIQPVQTTPAQTVAPAATAVLAAIPVRVQAAAVVQIAVPGMDPGTQVEVPTAVPVAEVTPVEVTAPAVNR